MLCGKDFYDELNFLNLFKLNILCQKCRSCLQVIDFSNSCQVCGNELPCCEQEPFNNRSVYMSNKVLMDLITKVKFKQDLWLLNIVAKDVRRVARKYFKNHSVVFVPLSKERMKERDFNQSEILASYTKLKTIDCLRRIDNEKQSKKTLEERIANPPKFELVFNPNNKKILIIDDIYTTGYTLRSIVDLFDETYQISCMTLIRIRPIK